MSSAACVAAPEELDDDTNEVRNPSRVFFVLYFYTVLEEPVRCTRRW